MDTAWLVLSALFSLIGFAVFTYGRRQRRGVPMITGVALMAYSYFVSNVLILVAVGLVLLIGLVVGSRWEEEL